ncbi:MAG: PQQ-dependent sugar dehydrogenase [Variovorax sp.]
MTAGLEYPWAVAPLADGSFLVTERPGRLRRISAIGEMSEPIQGLPRVAVRLQGGLLDLVTDSGFARNRTLYFCYSEPSAEDEELTSTAMARATLSRDFSRLENVKVIFVQQPKVEGQLHFGCRIAEARDGTLFLTLGERVSRREDAQRLENHLGKVVRVGKDGSIPRDNPFVGKRGARPEIWSYGHRNSQGATIAPDGRFWMVEHGPTGGDEINLPLPGRNYGWPVISYGKNLDGSPVGEGRVAQPGMEQPLLYWAPSLAPSGMAFLTSDRYGPAWKGNLFVGSLRFRYLNRIEFKGGATVVEHKLLADRQERIRDVRQGPDGLLYVVTDEENGKLIRLLPR